jgi:oligopeptide/dipeptide ABC transporter ATP-binding protein
LGAPLKESARTIPVGCSPVDDSVSVAPCNTRPLECLDVRDLRVCFSGPRGHIIAVDALSYRLRAGMTLAIIGESGSGKTASCRALMGLLPETATVSGSATLYGSQLVGLSEAAMRRHRGSGIAMVFQDPARSLNPTMRVGRQITEAIRLHGDCDRATARTRAIELLELLQIPGAKQRIAAYPHELSGGMRQRILIAIALAGHPRVLIADEATRSLDAITQAQILTLLKRLQHQLGMAMIMVSHDLRAAIRFADEVLVMYRGQAVEKAAADRLFRASRMRYTRALFAAIPGTARTSEQPLSVDLTRAVPPAGGCAFEPRCTYTTALCREDAPTMAEHEPGHHWACWNPCRDPE